MPQELPNIGIKGPLSCLGRIFVTKHSTSFTMLITLLYDCTVLGSPKKQNQLCVCVCVCVCVWLRPRTASGVALV